MNLTINNNYPMNNKLLFFIILKLIIGLSQGCSIIPKSPECPVGVKFLNDVTIESSQSYLYSIDQGRQKAKEIVRFIALQEASESYKLRLISRLKSSIICTTHDKREICDKKIKHFIQLTSDNLVDKVETTYQDISLNKICVTAIIHFRNDFDRTWKDETTLNENDGRGNTAIFEDPLGSEIQQHETPLNQDKGEPFIDPLVSSEMSQSNDNDNDNFHDPLNSEQK